MRKTTPEPFSVVVADDDASFRHVVTAILAEDDDIDIVGQAGDGALAIALAVGCAPDVVLLDLYMPDGGVAAVRAIHRQVPTTKVVILSSSDNDDDIYEALKAGASGYVLKSASLDELGSVVRAMSRGVGLFLSPAIASRVLEEFDHGSDGPV